MSDLNKDTNILITDFFNILERYLIIAWNGLMRLFIGVRIMPLFNRYPKSLITLIVLMCFITPPIAIFWIALEFAALNNQPSMDNNFIIDKRRIEEQLDEVNKAQAEQDLEKFHSVLVDEMIKITERPLHQLPETIKYCHSIYSLQAAKMAAKIHYINDKSHEQFAIDQLCKAGYSRSLATHILHEIKNINSDIMLDEDSSPFKMDGGAVFRDWKIKDDEEIIKQNIRQAYESWLRFEKSSKTNQELLRMVAFK